jgi:hypothetical protein
MHLSNEIDNVKVVYCSPLCCAQQIYDEKRKVKLPNWKYVYQRFYSKLKNQEFIPQEKSRYVDLVKKIQE